MRRTSESTFLKSGNLNTNRILYSAGFAFDLRGMGNDGGSQKAKSDI